MNPSRLSKLLIAVVLLGPCAGCCCHNNKKGITLRGGLDFREYKKPAGFVELVETGWDERRRLQDMRWLENSGVSAAPASATDDCPSASTTPTSNVPPLKEPPAFEPPPMPEESTPAPPVPPDPGPEPQLQQETDVEFDEFEQSVSVPTSALDEQNDGPLVELSGYQRPVRAVANQGATARFQPTQQIPPPPRKSGWLWSKR